MDDPVRQHWLICATGSQFIYGWRMLLVLVVSSCNIISPHPPFGFFLSSPLSYITHHKHRLCRCRQAKRHSLTTHTSPTTLSLSRLNLKPFFPPLWLCGRHSWLLYDIPSTLNLHIYVISRTDQKKNALKILTLSHSLFLHLLTRYFVYQSGLGFFCCCCCSQFFFLIYLLIGRKA